MFKNWVLASGGSKIGSRTDSNVLVVPGPILISPHGSGT